MKLTQASIKAWCVITFLTGIVIIVLMSNPWNATAIGVVSSCIISGGFTFVYGLKSAWRRNPVATAFLYIIGAYFLLSFHISISYLYTPNYPLRDDIRQFLFVILNTAGVNLVLQTYYWQRVSQRAREESPPQIP